MVPSPAHKTVFVVILCILTIFAALQVQVPSAVVDVQDSLAPSIIVSDDEPYINYFVSNGVAAKLKIEFQSVGLATLVVGNESIDCDSSTCVLIVKPEYPLARFELRTNSQVIVNNFTYIVVKYKRLTTLTDIGESQWLYVVGSLIVLLLLAGVLGGASPLVQWVTIILVAGFLAINDLLFALILAVFLAAVFLIKNHFQSDDRRVFGLVLFVASAIGFLLLFKYAMAGIYSIFADPGSFGLLMPLGVSYFVIRIIDTQLRWFRQQEHDLTFREFVFFVIFPGTLVAGPIENIQAFYANRVVSIGKSDYASGVTRLALGIFKKVVIADAYLYPAIHGQEFANLLWGGSGGSVNQIIADPLAASGGDIFAFALAGLFFAYIDFSAYSDMAIGFSRLLGYKICENFNYPMFAQNIREYWKRWHMSLSNWAFRNIYFPLLLKSQNSYLPLYVTMLTIGLWHAFNLSWFSWALHHASGMTVVATLQKKVKVNKQVLLFLLPIRMFLTITFVSMGFVFVYFDDYTTALALYIKLWEWLIFLGWLP